MAITYSIPNTEIIVTTGQTQVTCQDLVNSVRDHETTFQMMSNTKVMDAEGKVSIGAVSSEIIVKILDPWTIRFEDEATDHTSIIGGTIVALDDLGASRTLTTNPSLTINQSISGTLVETGVSGLTASESTQLDGIHGELTDIEGVFDHSDLMRGMWAMLAGHISGAEIGVPGTATISDMANTKTRITMDFDAHGNRLSVTFNDLT